MKHAPVIIYIGGPISSKQPMQVNSNIGRGVRMSVKLWELGIPNYCPHSLAFLAQLKAKFRFGHTEDWWREVGWHMASMCNAILLLEGWQTSKGTLLELERIQQKRCPEFEGLDSLLVWLKEAYTWEPLDSR